MKFIIYVRISNVYTKHKKSIDIKKNEIRYLFFFLPILESFFKQLNKVKKNVLNSFNCVYFADKQKNFSKCICYGPHFMIFIQDLLQQWLLLLHSSSLFVVFFCLLECYVFLLLLNIAIKLCCYEKKHNTKLGNSIPSVNFNGFIFNVFNKKHP